MAVLGELLKPGGVFCHSDWPKSDDKQDRCTEEKAAKIYDMAGLKTKSIILETTIQMGSHEGGMFVGVAMKPKQSNKTSRIFFKFANVCILKSKLTLSSTFAAPYSILAPFKREVDRMYYFLIVL
jgi:hypothetical protein